MYLKYWNLQHLPFENVPDPKYYFDSAIHHAAIEDLRDAIMSRKGAIALTGDIGCGKTTITQRVLLSLPEKRFDIAFITYPSLSPLEMLREINQQLGLEKCDGGKNDLLHILQRHLAENAATDRDTLICIDEAQSIPSLETFEELRLLLNFQLAHRFLLTLVFVGQPELQAQIIKLPQLRQRIALHLHLGPLSAEDTARYVQFRLKAAGCQRSLLTLQAVESVHMHTGGVPRRINHLMDHCLIHGMRKGASLLDSQLITETMEMYPT
jgi:general secretion pathway protein A